MKWLIVLFLSTRFALAQAPEWYTSHSHPKYPARDYLLGIGSGSGMNGAETAKKSALSDIVSQLRVQVQSEMKTVTESFAVNDDEQIYSDFKRQSRTMVNDEITGAEVAATVTDQTSSTTYVLMVLDREAYSGNLRSELESGWKQAADLRLAAADFFAKGKLIEAVQSTQQIRQVIAPLFAKQVLHNAAAKSPFAFPSVFNPAALQNDIRTFLSRVTVEKRSGDGQKGKIGQPFPQPFVVGVTANGVPCSGVTVQFQLEGGGPLGEAITEAAGTASFSTIVRNGTGMRARLSIPGLGREFEQNLNASSVSFTWTAQASDKAFSVNVSSRYKKTGDLVQSKLTAAISGIGYKVVTMSGHAVTAEVSAGVPGKIEGLAGTIYNVTMTVSVSVKDHAANAVLGTAEFSAKGAGKSEEEAMEKAAAGLKIDQNVLAGILQK